MKNVLFVLILIFNIALCTNLIAQNYCLNFDGNDYIALPNGLYNDNLNNGTAITIEFMFSGTVLQSAVRFQDGSNYVIAGYGSGDPEFVISSDGGTTSGVVIAASADVEDENWHHVAMTWTRNGNMITYLDGVQKNTRAAADVTLPTIGSGCRLGSYGSGEYLTGNLDEVRIWNIERSLAQIQSTMNTSLTGSESGLIAYYKMSDGSGTTLTDNQTAGNYSSTGWSGATWVTLPFSGGYGTTGNPWQIANLTDLGLLSSSSAYWDENFLQTANIDASTTSTWNSGAGWSPIGTGSDPFTGTYNGNNCSISGLTIYRSGSVQAFIGAAGNAIIENLTLSSASIETRGQDQKTGALIGESYGSSVTNCHASGTVKGMDYVGGLIGYNSSSVSNCSYTGTVQGNSLSGIYQNDNMGGLIGYNNGGSIEDSYASATITGNWIAGGLVGYNNAGTINKCYSSSPESGQVFGSYFVGGLVGQNYGSGSITESYSTATVVGYTNIAGGLVGGNNNSSINNCYSRGSVSRTQDTQGSFGSFIGKNENTTVIEYCYSTGAVIYQNADNPTDKGFIGNYNATGCSNNFFDSQTTEQTSGAGATAKSTTDMTSLSTFTDAGWDFAGENINGTDDIWSIDDLNNDGYPFLCWQGGLIFPLAVPENIVISLSDTDVTITWDAVLDATSYKVFSSDDPETGFTEDSSGSFTDESWTAPISESKKFYYVKAVN